MAASSSSFSSASVPRVIGRYAIYDAIASGGMATIHLGRLSGPVGFTKTVAVKRLHAQYANDPEFVAMFLDEARLAARIHHPNVVQTLDVVSTDGELFLVMEYVRGETLGRLVKTAFAGGRPISQKIVVAIISSMLQGLHAAHEASDDGGRALALVHRDVSPQNVIVGLDGTARVLDFGVAKASNRSSSTREGQLKGKLLYMSPEQLEGEEIDRRTDIYAAAIVLFETLTGIRMFSGKSEGAQIAKITRGEITLPSTVNAELAPFDPIILKGAALHRSDRYATAREMALALEKIVPPASATEIAEWVETIGGPSIHAHDRQIAELETQSRIQPSHRKKRPVWPFALVALISMPIIAGVGIWISVKHGNPQVVTSTPTAASVPAPIASTVEAVPPAPPSATPSITVATPRPKTFAPKKPDCEQPYIVDSVGHMHFRKECLPR